MSTSRFLILFVLISLLVLSSCNSDGGFGSTDPDGDDTDGDVVDGDDSDGDVIDGDDDNPVDGDVDVDDTDIDMVDGDVVDSDAVDIDIVDGDVIDIDMADGDVEEDGEMEIAPQLNTPHFSGFTASGGSASSGNYNIVFRLSPAALTVKAANSNYHLNATITPKSN